jgi:hypothetical protein
MVPEPRRIAGLDADGDGDRDLAMISQDRLVVYLSAADPGEQRPGPDDQGPATPHDEAGR